MNDNLTNIEIPVSKSKIILLLIASITFVLIGVFLVLDPSRFISIFIQNLIVISAVGYISIAFFGFGIFIFITRLYQTKPGLIITDKGIFYDTKDKTNGFVDWNRIMKISTINIFRQRMIMIHVNNPDDFIKSQTKAIKRKLMTYNQNNFNAPIGLTTSGFAISFDSLHELIMNNFNKYKQK